jgi:hypothetical protein
MARREGISSPFSDAGGCTSRQNSGFGGSFALDLVALIASGPAEADRVAGVFDFEAGLQGAEGDFAALGGDRQRRLAAEIERARSQMSASTIRQRPIRRQLAGGLDAGASRSLGNRARL